MTAPTKELEKLVVPGKLRHGGHPVLRWMASNVAVEMDPAGNVKPSKNKSTERIEGIVATIMALGRAMLEPPPSSPYFEDHQIIFVSWEPPGSTDGASPRTSPSAAHNSTPNPTTGRWSAWMMAEPAAIVSVVVDRDALRRLP